MQAVLIVNNCWGSYGSPKIRVFCLEKPPTDNDPLPDNRKDQFPLRMHIGQPVMVKLPSIGIMPMTLAKPRGLYAWEALDENRKKHSISAQWIVPDF